MAGAKTCMNAVEDLNSKSNQGVKYMNITFS